MSGPRAIDPASRRFLSGDPAQVCEIRDEVRRAVRAFHLPSSDVEEDLVQETLSRLVESLSKGRFRGESSLSTYARNIARHTFLHRLRDRRAQTGLDPETLASQAQWSDPEESILESEEHRRNLEAFAALPAECRELLLLINVQGLSYSEVGLRLGVTEGAIKSRVRRMRDCIRRLLKPRRAIPGRREARSISR
jgi:RNA polymerase sigma-70 factor (ECF subfamily)